MSPPPATPSLDRERWPRDVCAPADDDELFSGMYAVHEAAHAISGAHQGIAPLAIRVSHTNPGIMGTQFCEDRLGGDAGAVLALAARPAVWRWLRAVGAAQPINLYAAEGQFRIDRRDARRWAHTDLDVLTNQARHEVKAHWSEILALAQRIADHRGQLDAPIFP